VWPDVARGLIALTASTGETRVLDAPPSTVSLVLEAALPAVPGLHLVPGVRKHGGLLPDLTLTQYDVRVDRAHLTAYSLICGFRLAISPSERLEVAARPRSLRSHPKGRLFDLVTEVRAGGELVWEESSTFVRLGEGVRVPAQDRARHVDQGALPGRSRGRLPDAVDVQVAFKKPVLLSGTVALGAARSSDGYEFALTRPSNGAPHLLGRSAVPACGRSVR